MAWNDLKKKTWVQVGFLLVIVGVIASILAPKIPRSQRIRLHLGNGSSQVLKLTARVGHGQEWDRQTEWVFTQGAPPSVVWIFEQPNESLHLEVEISTERRSTLYSTQVDLRANELTIELHQVIQKLNGVAY